MQRFGRSSWIVGLLSASLMAATTNVAASAKDKAPPELRFARIFTDHMVLQQDKPMCVWGWARPGAKVTVTLTQDRAAGEAAMAKLAELADRGNRRRPAPPEDDGSYSVTVRYVEKNLPKLTPQAVDVQAGPTGRWTARFKPAKASFQPTWIIAASGDDLIAVRDVLIGEVWLCGGQSNMAWTLRSTRDADVEMPSANYPAMRFIRLPHIARLEPQTDFPAESPQRPEGNWRLCTTEQAGNCTGVGYYFARRLHRRLRVPIGLIDTSWGGTMAQHWVPKDVLREIPEVKPYFDKFNTALQAWIDGGKEAGAKRRYEADVKAWETRRAEAKAKGKREPRRPNLKAYTNPADKGQPGGMFNGMIAPLAGFTLRGVLFYQGENNSFTVGWKPFPKTFPAVIAAWRKAFGDEKLPFGIIQIAGWSTRRGMKYDMNHHTNIVREVQFLTWKRTPNTGLIVTFDTNSSRGIHPIRKLPVGERSARWALAAVYGAKGRGPDRRLEWRGPVYESMAIEKGKIIIGFEEGTNRGLVLARDDESGLYVAGSDREFHHARARVVKDNKLMVWSQEVAEPVAVRYAWSNLPAGALMNRRELPAYPFRTDTWPLVPHQSTGAYEVDRE
jgi:sialate O-acetylesterase